MTKAKEKIVVSACLLGERCRYDGKIIENTDIKKMADNFELIPVCPEILGGLPIPRRPSEIESGDGNSVLDGRSRIFDDSGKDVTANFLIGAEKVLEIVKSHNVQRVMLKSKSPSCGVTCIIRKSNKVKGCGVTAALLSQNGLSPEEFD